MTGLGAITNGLDHSCQCQSRCFIHGCDLNHPLFQSWIRYGWYLNLYIHIYHIGLAFATYYIIRHISILRIKMINIICFISIEHEEILENPIFYDNCFFIIADNNDYWQCHWGSNYNWYDDCVSFIYFITSKLMTKLRCRILKSMTKRRTLNITGGGDS